MYSYAQKESSPRLRLTICQTAVFLVSVCGAVSLSAQTINGGEVELRCESPLQYSTISFDSEMKAACSDLRDKSDQLIERARGALLSPGKSSWRPSWFQSPQCKEDEFRVFEESSLELREAIGKTLRSANRIIDRSSHLMKIAQEMKSIHNAERAGELGKQATVFLDMWEDVFTLVPQVYVEYADRALAAKCYQQADKAYRFVVEHYTGDRVTALRERAKIGIEDVRARQK